MGKKILSAALFSLCISVGSPSLAGFEDGNSIYGYCKPNVPQWQTAVCVGYVSAIADLLENGHPFTPMKACIPFSVSKQQLMDIVVAYFKDRPERRHYLAAGEVTYAFMQAFPCR